MDTPEISSRNWTIMGKYFTNFIQQMKVVQLKDFLVYLKSLGVRKNFQRTM
jgi:hypothetical protein